MPSHYIAQTCKDTRTSSPDYLVRNIEGLTTGDPITCYAIGIPLEDQPHYREYVANIASFLQATATGRKVTCGGRHMLTLDLDKCLPLPLPNLHVAPRRAFASDIEKLEFKSKFPQDAYFTNFKKRDILVIPHPDPLDLPTFPASDPATPSPVDAVNMVGMISYMYVVRLISLFAATHTYPAFQSETAAPKASYSHDVYVEAAYKSNAAMRGIRESYPALGKRAFKAFPAELDVEDFKEANEFNGTGTVSVAKPAPLYPMVNCGGPQQIPNLPGYHFPYFHGMMFPSRQMILDIFRRYFDNCLGEDATESGDAWKKFMHGVDRWYKTPEGIALSHILYLVQTTLECQGRLFIIVSNGEYQGGVIQGYRFNILMRDMLFVPDSQEKLQELAFSADAHHQAMLEVIKILKSMKLKDAEDDDQEMNDSNNEIDISTPRKLYQQLAIRERPGVDVLPELKETVGRLAYKQSYWPVKEAYIVNAIKFLSSPPEDTDDWPMFLDPANILDFSIEHKVLSAFGPVAPSFIDHRGKEYQIPKSLEAADPLSESAEGSKEKKMPAVTISLKKFNAALTDLKSLVRNRKIKQNLDERAAGYRTMVFRRGGRDSIWNALKSLPALAKVEKKKRARDEDSGDDEEAGSSKKAKKDDEVEEVAFM